MPWKERQVMSLKMEFVERASREGANVSALCREYGISREAGHKWLRRFEAQGYDGLEERSRRPRKTPLATAEDIVLAVLSKREAHPGWGPKKLCELLRSRFGKQTPSRATIARILQRFGQVQKRRRKAPMSIIERAPTVVAKKCNEVWTVDFKGWWRARDGARCEPLTVRDAFSRFVLCARLLKESTVGAVREQFETLFRRYGVPSAMQCDNGAPFISVQSRAGLTQLSAWWVSLGIAIVRSRPGCPQDNGAHERMHRDMRADVEAFPQANRLREQRALDRWRQEFNHVRPHEALRGKPPAKVYRAGERRSLRPPRWHYPVGWATKRAHAPNGGVFLHGESQNLGRAFVGYTVGIEPISNASVRVWLHDVELGELHVGPSTPAIDAVCAGFMRRSNSPRKAA
jgi:transposase InsO family protein